jgi:hypothetical protein
VNHSNSSLGDVLVSVLATGPKGRGFEPSQGDGSLKAIKILSTLFFVCEVKPEVVRFYDILKISISSTGKDRLNFSFPPPILLLAPEMSLLTGPSEY